MSFQDFVADTLEDCVATRIDKNPDRSALDNLELQLLDQIAENRYNNDTFWKLVDAILERVDDWENELLRDDFERKAHKNVNEFLDCLLADTITSKRMLNDLNDRDYNWVEDVVHSELYRFFFESRVRRRRDDGYRNRDRGRGYRDDRHYEEDRRPARRETRDSGYSGRSRVRDNSHVTKRTVSNNNAFLYAARMREEQERNVPEEQAPVRQRERSRDYDRTNYAGRVQDVEVESTYDRGNDREVEEPRDVQRETVSSVKPTGKRVLTAPPLSKQGYDHTSESPFEEFWEDNCLWQASVITKWKLTGEGIDGYMQLYNIYKWVSYHVMDEFGNVTQRFKEVTDDNRYLNQSLLKDPDTFRSNFGRKPPKISDLMRGDTVEVKEGPAPDEGDGYELEDMIDLSPSDFDNMSTLIPSENLSTSAIEARTRLNESGKDSSLNIFMLMDPVEAVTSQEASMIRDLYSANTLMALSKNLNALKGKISNATFAHIDGKISRYLIDILLNTFGVPIKKLEFSSDWPVVIQGLLKRRGQEWVDNFARRANTLIPTILSFVDATDANGNIEDIFENIVTVHNKNRIIPYVDFYALISINCTLDQLSIGRQVELESPLILRSADDIYSSSVLNTILEALDSVRDRVNVNRLLLSTRCGALVNVTRHELSGGNIVLSMFSPSK